MTKHNVFCYECRKWKDFEVAGDLGQYDGDTLDCPCGEEVIVPKCFSDSKWGLFHVASLEPPSDVHRWLSNNLSRETRLKRLGYFYSTPCSDWNYNHLFTPDGGIVPVSDINDPYIDELLDSIAIPPNIAAIEEQNKK